MAHLANNKEQISALVDGELQDKVLLELLSDEPEMAGTFARYHLYGDALRSDLATHLHQDMSDNVMAALADDAPFSGVHTTANLEPANQSAPSTNSNVVRARFGKLAPMLRYAGQFAIAASVSAALIVGVQQYSQQDLQSPVLNTVPLNGGATPVSLNYKNSSLQPTQEQAQLEQQRRIHELLMDHELQQRLRQH
ncbi:transcriptional regulator [Oceanisphaera avium]|uniref:Anti-sigma-E factor RseA n=2 Tax=Oceanisphaera avium TaxID=1903694 RepID=A0A1Y0D217_9GAMM|nr:transcriptional regulator [Oceanisphaera avium]